MNIVDLLDQIGVPYKSSGHHHCRTGWVQIDCPYCSPGSQRWRMGINLAGLYANCWFCGHHSLQSLLYELAGDKLLELKGIVKRLERIDEVHKERVVHKGKLVLPKGIEPMAKQHKEYLVSRGFDPDRISKVWGVMGIGPKNEQLAWRLFIPIIFEGEIVSWITRALGDGRRYVGAARDEESLPRKDLLYGEDFCRNKIIVCEGPFDVWRLGPSAVATLGVNFSMRQLMRIARYPLRVILFDNDAKDKARELADLLAPFPGDTYNVTLGKGKDPADAPRDEINSFLKWFHSQ